jgi:hypothetical protein
LPTLIEPGATRRKTPGSPAASGRCPNDRSVRFSPLALYSPGRGSSFPACCPGQPDRSKGDKFNVSPKLTEGINHGADPAAKRIRPQAIADLLATGRAVWKFVAADQDDLKEIDWWIGEFQLPVDAVWVMPEGTSADRIIANAQQLADGVLARGLNLTTRLHTLIWGAERGR